jgi:hypothetical protein
MIETIERKALDLKRNKKCQWQFEKKKTNLV